MNDKTIVCESAFYFKFLSQILKIKYKNGGGTKKKSKLSSLTCIVIVNTGKLII